MLREKVLEVIVRRGALLTAQHAPRTTPRQPAEILVNFNEESLVLSHEVKAQLALVLLSSGTARTTVLQHVSSHLKTTDSQNISKTPVSISHLLKLEEEGEIHFLKNISHMFVNEMEDKVVRTVSFRPAEDTDIGADAQSGLTQPVGVEFVDGERFTASSVVDNQSSQIFTLEM